MLWTAANLEEFLLEEQWIMKVYFRLHTVVVDDLKKTTQYIKSGILLLDYMHPEVDLSCVCLFVAS